MRSTLLAAFLLACAEPEPPRFEDYDATCAVAEECAVVVQSRDCGFGCETERACLTTDAVEAYREAESDYVDWLCGGTFGLVGCSSTPSYGCACEAEVCQLVAAPAR